ncbi:ATP-binding protein [Actinomadura hibisca]|uniref:ATP-binding protein n=1 Tax=Actinomadura hibisca TaxID=68565 RepID=UPI0014721F47|nr:ATP-binding protein [Actinomadura hibisca]
MRASPESVGRARSFIAAHSDTYDADPDTCQAIISELATNAVVHGSNGGRCEAIIIRFYLSDQGPVIEVWDGSNAAPIAGRLESMHESGRGLAMVELMSRTLGYVPLVQGGKIVYAILEREQA